MATRTSVDEKRREWLLTTPWQEFPNWRRWKPEIEILFERVMQEQADKVDLQGPWLVEYTHGVLTYQRIDGTIGWENAKELWADFAGNESKAISQTHSDGFCIRYAGLFKGSAFLLRCQCHRGLVGESAPVYSMGWPSGGPNRREGQEV